MKIAVYHRSVGNYAGGFLVRQGNSLDATHVSGPARWTADVDHRAVRVPVADAPIQRVTTMARGAGISVGGPPSLTRELHGVLSEFDVTYTMFLGTAFDLYPLARRGITYVVHAGGSDVTTLRGVTRGYRRASIKAAHGAAMVLVGSRFLQERYRAVDPDTSTTLHYIGVDLPDVVPPTTASDFRIVAASRLHPVKGVDRTMIETALQTDGKSDDDAARVFARRRRLGPYRTGGKRDERRDKDLAAMCRAGFSFEIARRIIDAENVDVLENDSDDQHGAGD